jgi:hypothetical protein
MDFSSQNFYEQPSLMQLHRASSNQKFVFDNTPDAGSKQERDKPSRKYEALTRRTALEAVLRSHQIAGRKNGDLRR